MKHFLFVVPRYTDRPGKFYVFPIGLAYVVSYMKQKGFKVFCLNLCHYNDSIENLLVKSIKENSIDVLCTGAMSFYWNEVSEILEAAKTIKPEIVTIVGGALLTSSPKLALENMRIDYGIIGEGERTMADLASVLCNGGDFTKINGIIYFNKNKELITTQPRELIADLDTLPFPDYEALEYDKWLSIKWIVQPSLGGLYFDIYEEQRLCEIVSTRGCPYNCTFCYHPLGRRYRQRSLDNVFDEIDYLVKRFNINILNLLDELFSLNHRRVLEFSDRIRKYNIKWMAQWRADNVSEEILKAVKESGAIKLGFGVESMSDKILQSMKKRIKRSQIEQAFKIASDVKIAAGGNVIIGDPEETEETIKESITWWQKHRQYDINLGFILAVPDSYIYKYAISNKLIKDEIQFIKNRFPIINLTKISDKIFNKIIRKIRYYSITQRYLLTGTVLSSKKENETYDNKNIYSFNVRCPVCNKDSKYKYFQYSTMPYSLVLCKYCYKRIKIRTTTVFYDDYNAIYGNLIYYGAIINNYLGRYSIIYKVGKKIKSKIIKNITTYDVYLSLRKFR